MRNKLIVGFCLAMGVFTSCDYDYKMVNVEGGRVPMTKVYDTHEGDKEVSEIMNKYKAKLDSMMSPIVGYAAKNLDSYRPESPLSNLIADLLRRSTGIVTGHDADFAVMNMGGIRSSLAKGPITYGNLFEVSPFENSLCIMTMQGNVVLELFSQIAALHGEGLSGAKLEITKDGKLLSAKVGGKNVDPKKVYTVATLDYLAEGNDKMPAFLKAQTKLFPQDAALREMLRLYVKQCQFEGIKVDAKVEGRIVVK